MDWKAGFLRLFGGKEKLAQEPYLAVKISQDEVVAALWNVISGQVVVGTAYREPITGNSFKEVLIATDKVVSQALEAVKEVPQVKTIFGFNPNWISDGKIIDEKRRFLKALCQELDLQPIGYVLLAEAVENYLSQAEGAPLTAILVSLESEQQGWVTLVQAGKNLGTVALDNSVQGLGLAERVERSLHQFEKSLTFPARIILFGYLGADFSAEKLLAYPWAKNLPFLHFPKVETLAGEMLVKAVAAAAGLQMGGRIEEEMLDSEQEKELVAEKETPAVENLTGEAKTDALAVSESPSEVEELTAAEAGFVFEEDKTTITFPQSRSPGSHTIKDNVSTLLPAEDSSAKVIERFKAITEVLGQIGRKIGRFIRNFSLSAGVVLEGRKIGILLGVGGFLGVVLLVGSVLYFVPRATIIVRVAPKTFTRELTATISGQIVEARESGSKTGVVTGRKLVGEKATGVVTIYGAGPARTFPAGTVLTSPDNLKFTLDKDVFIASASDFLTPSTATGRITAVDIGDKYNLAPNTKFSIGGSSLYLAKNESTLTGGSSREANVVAKIDQDRLVATLSAELALKAEESLKAKLLPGQQLLPNAITATVVKKVFSKDVGAEADNLSLDLTMDFKGVTVSQEDLLREFVRQYPQDIPAGYYFDIGASTPEIKSAKLNKAGEVVLTIVIKGVAMPTLHKEAMVAEIAGKRTKEGENLLLGKTGVKGVMVIAEPKFFQFWVERFLPFSTNNLSLELVRD